MLKFLKCNHSFRLFAINRKKHTGINSNLKSLLEMMPKVRKHVPDAQKQRKLIKEKFSKYVPGRITLQVLGTGAIGAPRCLYVFSDQARYIFNCGEGSQRLAHEQKMKLAKLEHIFVTQNVWSNIGGLPGLALTIQDVGVPQITLHGPKGLEQIFNATKRFVILRDLHIEMAKCQKKGFFEDNVMNIKYVPIKKTSKNNEKSSTVEPASIEMSIDDKQVGVEKEEPEDSTDYYAYEQLFSKLVTNPTQSTNITNDKENGVIMNYICKLKPRPGTLSLDKCVKFGVPPGPLLGRLKMGNSIKLPSGVVVHSADVCEPDDPGPVFLVVDCPSEEYLDAFLSNSQFKLHQEKATSNDMFAHLVVHFTPSHILNLPQYKDWMNHFSPSTHHLVLNDSNTCMGSESVHRIQYKLNLLYENLFPILGDTGSKYSLDKCPVIKKPKVDEEMTTTCESVADSVPETKAVVSSVSNELMKVNTFCGFHLRPKKGLDRSNELIIKPAEYVAETLADYDFKTTLAKLKESIRQAMRNKTVHTFPRFIFLGTGSCIPNKTRNTSGILYEIHNGINMLLDCGEGTYGQLVRFHGCNKSDDILCGLKAIYISHLHADHHIGLIGVLQGRRRALIRKNKTDQSKLLLLAPKQIMTWLKFYDAGFESICQEFELIPNDSLLFEEHTLFEGDKVRLYASLGMYEINTALVRHCPNAFGIALTSRAGYKICYSGDTMPSESLIEIGNRCDLLIHEATMEDELEHEAVLKMHSTTTQAIEVGKNMNAKHIMLTHFSQRYAKLPKFNDNFTDNVGIAFDNMQVCLDELPLIPLLYPALRIMFAEHYEELETKSLKRLLKLEREESLSTILTGESQKQLTSAIDKSKAQTCTSNTSPITKITKTESPLSQSPPQKNIKTNKPEPSDVKMQVDTHNVQ